jgi:hypothetical protein
MSIGSDLMMTVPIRPRGNLGNLLRKYKDRMNIEGKVKCTCSTFLISYYVMYSSTSAKVAVQSMQSPPILYIDLHN